MQTFVFNCYSYFWVPSKHAGTCIGDKYNAISFPNSIHYWQLSMENFIFGITKSQYQGRPSLQKWNKHILKIAHLCYFFSSFSEFTWMKDHIRIGNMDGLFLPPFTHTRIRKFRYKFPPSNLENIHAASATGISKWTKLPPTIKLIKNFQNTASS